MKKTFLLSFCLLMFTHGSAQKPTRQIIIIIADDLGWKDVGFNGSTYYDTPHLDKLAANSLKYTNAYANASNCAPSRACLMSGAYSPRHGVYTVSPPDRGHEKTRKLIASPNNNLLPDGYPTLATYFQRAGFATGVFGKWHIGEDPTEQGFDVHKGGGRAGHPKAYFSPYKLQFLTDGPEREELTDRITAEAIAFIEANKDNSFLLYLPHFAIHTPLQGKEKLVKKYKNKPPSGGQGSNADYAAMTENLDTNIGKLLDAVKRTELKDPFIVFSSDNGGIASLSRQWPLRAGKGSYYEGGIRVPLLISHSSVQKGISDAPVLLFDLFPTLCEWANITVPESHIMDGVPLQRSWENPTDNFYENRPLFFHFPFYLQAYEVGGDDGRDDLFRTRPGSVIRLGNWKLHHYFEDDSLELYDLNNDPGERINLANSKPDLVKKLYEKLENWRKETSAVIPTELNPAYDEAFVPNGVPEEKKKHK
jgi:arylsulfatase A-like enzyme